MFNTLKNAWRIPDLRKKLLYTLLIIIAFRFGSVVPVPFLNVSALNTLMASANETALGYINMLPGGKACFGGFLGAMVQLLPEDRPCV